MGKNEFKVFHSSKKTKKSGEREIEPRNDIAVGNKVKTIQTRIFSEQKSEGIRKDCLQYIKIKEKNRKTIKNDEKTHNRRNNNKKQIFMQRRNGLLPNAEFETITAEKVYLIR